MDVESRNIYDVTGTVEVNSSDAVCAAVQALFSEAYPQASFDTLSKAFRDFNALFTGQVEGFEGCDTAYHDIQHTLDVTLAMARLVAGHDIERPAAERIGDAAATVAVIAALFHDSGYIRRSDGESHRHGAEYTRTHIARGAAYLGEYLSDIGLGRWASVAGQILHFTGYEVPIQRIALEDPRHRLLGQMLGTADLIAQMADRCYLEKCRDRLYPEFVLGGIAIDTQSDGGVEVIYSSGVDLLKKTPSFYEHSSGQRLEADFGRAYRFVESLYDGENPYMKALERNLAYLEVVLEGENWPLLRRRPPCFTWREDNLDDIRHRAAERLKSIRHIATAV